MVTETYVTLFLSASLFVAICFAALLAIVLYNIRKRYLLLKINRVNYSSKFLNKLNDILKQRTGISEYLAITNQNNGDLNEVYEKVDNFVSNAVEKTKEMFELSTGHYCSVCVKLIEINSDDTAKVYTFMRDSESYYVRSKIKGYDGSLNVDEHSPFASIITRADAHYMLDGVYINNELVKDFETGNYVNSNPSWRELYNATCIAPIKNPSDNAEQELIGFICVDSKNGRFDDDFSSSALQIVSGALFYALDGLADIVAIHSEPIEKTTSDTKAAAKK